MIPHNTPNFHGTTPDIQILFSQNFPVFIDTGSYCVIMLVATNLYSYGYPPLINTYPTRHTMYFRTDNHRNFMEENKRTMPLNLAEMDIDYTIQKICGNEDDRHYLETLGFIEGATVRIVSILLGSYIVRIKESKIGINQDFAKMIIVQA